VISKKLAEELIKEYLAEDNGCITRSNYDRIIASISNCYMAHRDLEEICNVILRKHNKPIPTASNLHVS
jgi:hypothetical protein